MRNHVLGRRVWVLLLVVASGAAACNSTGSTKNKDAGPDSSQPDSLGDVAPGNDVDAGSGESGEAGQTFALLVTQSPPGPSNGIPANWGGVLQYTLSGNGATLQPAAGIAKGELADPVSLAFRAASSEVFVGNRHGNNAADGTAGSISRFIYDKVARTFSANGKITGNGLSGVHDLTFNPVNGELFAANFVGGISRFTFDANGAAVPNGIIADGTIRGVVVSATGKRLYFTQGTTVIRQFNLDTGTELTATTAPGAPLLHYLALRANQLYAGGLNDNLIHRFDLDVSEALTLKDGITGHAPVSIAFSPDTLEMFVGGHRDTDVIDRYLYNAGADSWSETTTFSTGSSLGGVLIIP